MRIQTPIIAVLVTSVIAFMLVGIVVQLEGNYGFSYNALTNDSNIGQVLQNITIYQQTQNSVNNASSYVPGQQNSLINDPTNPTASTQQSGFVAVLKYVSIMPTFMKAMFIAMTTYLGIEPTFVNMVLVIISLIISLTVAGIFLYRAL